CRDHRELPSFPTRRSSDLEYIEAGSYSEHTRDANVEDMCAIKLRQRVLVDVSQRKLSTTVLGEQLSMPLALAPTGLAGMQYADRSEEHTSELQSRRDLVCR